MDKEKVKALFYELLEDYKNAELNFLEKDEEEMDLHLYQSLEIYKKEFLKCIGESNG